MGRQDRERRCKLTIKGQGKHQEGKHGSKSVLKTKAKVTEEKGEQGKKHETTEKAKAGRTT
ncbi:9350_t:CDS:2 [Rhizophagus irregularis]|nr:9350_t:CDS:2 [Rhizophagus irregularis]